MKKKMIYYSLEQMSQGSLLTNFKSIDKEIATYGLIFIKEMIA